MNLKTLLVLLVMSIMMAWLAPELTKLASDQKDVVNMSSGSNNKYTNENYTKAIASAMAPAYNKVRAANKNHRVADYVRSRKQGVEIEKNSSLLGIIIAILLLFIVIGLPTLLWKNRVNNAVKSKKNEKSKTRTLYAHSTLMLDAQTEQTIGLANQYYFYRDKKITGTREQQQKRAFEEKETYRWKSCFECYSI